MRQRQTHPDFAEQTLMSEFAESGELKRRIFPDAAGAVDTNYAYDASGRLTRVQRNAGELVSSIAYTARGQVEKVVSGNGTEANYLYDAERGFLRAGSIGLNSFPGFLSGAFAFGKAATGNCR